MICGRCSRIRSPSPPMDALYPSTVLDGLAHSLAPDEAFAVSEIPEPRIMTTQKSGFRTSQAGEVMLALSFAAEQTQSSVAFNSKFMRAIRPPQNSVCFD